MTSKIHKLETALENAERLSAAIPKLMTEIADMGVSNLRETLTKRYGVSTGKIAELSKRVEAAERLYRVIPAMRVEIAKRKDELVHIAAVMHGFDPEWDPGSVPLIKSHTYLLPFRYGDCTVLAYDVLRESGRWMTVREVACRIFESQRIKMTSSMYQRVASNIGGGFRRRRQCGEVECDATSIPQRWRATTRKEKQVSVKS